MSAGSIVFSNAIRCGGCGNISSGYLQVAEDGNGVTKCPSCGSTIVQKLEHGFVSQVPPHRFAPSGGRAPYESRYPGLYAQPKHAPKLDLRNFFRLIAHPRHSLSELYLSTDLKYAMFLVVLSTTIYAVVGAAVTSEMSEVIGVGDANAFELLMLAALGWIVAIISFLVFAVVSSIVSHEVFDGRGDKGSTVALAGYCYPWFVAVTLVLLTIFAAGFGGLELSQVQHWGDSDMERAIAWGAVLLASAVLGLIWLLVLTGRAVSVANDVSVGEGILSAIIGAIAAGLVSLVVGAVMRLPIGLTL
ncbi:MAG: YIP1 family protein [Candidatus Thermoplasmatota archaeon]|nr:YIP1 family protein [Candidatus Thermoplasmatota archaeon]